ncbi:MAG: hypothetical protein SO019_09320 [Lachnospiraceae bacterium]|nr:hypothetical protein [Lachnospiraceae bacterium]
MLTITAPIELKCKAPENSMHEGFYHRIADQYSMMSINLTPEDLLHVMTTPPQYYFGGGDEMNIFQQTNVNAHEENKLEVINNLVNRIMVSESAQLTYQDRVYITDVIQKLGIRNVSEFMHQVNQLKQEQNNTNQLIDLYWNHLGELRQFVENYKTEQGDSHITEEITEQKEILHLHEDILNRLQTGAIYQTLQNFNNRTQGDWNITNTELALSEQYRTAQNILLQKLQSEARGEKTPLIYRHENYYEDQKLTQEQITEENIRNQVSSAVLLNLIDNVYQSRNEQIMRKGDQWYHMEEAFYQNAGNTMQRIKQKISAGNVFHTTQENAYVENYTQAQQNEISIINRLLDHRIQQEGTTQNRLIRQTLEEQNRLSQTNNYVDDRLQLAYTNIEEGDSFEEQTTYEQTQQIDKRDLSTVEQELSRINRENINNQSKYIQMMEGIRESMERPRERKSPEQMRRESLMALEHPTELLEQLHEEGQRQQLEKEEKLTQVMKMLPEQTREVYETVREYLAAPMELRREMTGVSDDMGMLIRDIHEAEVVREQTELVHKQQEQLHEQTREVIDRWKEQTPVEPQSKQVYEDRRTDVTLVHRSQEQQVDEELIQQMLEQNRTLSNTVRTQSETITNYDKTERTYNSVNTQQVIEQQEDVTELVRQGVQRELGALSEKIYHKLEKRLETEKRRRGY